MAQGGHFVTGSARLLSFVALGASLATARPGAVPLRAPLAHHQAATAARSIPSDCSSDVTRSLNRLLAAARRGAEVTLVRDGCYLAEGTVLLAHHTDVSINGNGATIEQPFYLGGGEVLPILQLSQDNDVTVRNLTLRGPHGVGNEYTEGDYGIKLDGDNGVSIAHVAVKDVEGDWLALYSGPGGALDRNVWVIDSSFSDAGYHGVTIESVDGVTFYHDTFTGVGLDGVDLEYDIYPTVFVKGEPTQGAEDNVTFEDTTWRSVGGIWVVSYQGQQVQENNLALLDNRLIGVGLSVGIIGNRLVPNSGLFIEGNLSTAPVTGVWGGSIVRPTSSAPIWLTYVDNVQILDNKMTLFDGTPTYYLNHPYMAAVQLYGSAGALISGNTFKGAEAPLKVDSLYYPTHRHWSGTPSQEITECGDSYGVRGRLRSLPCS